MKNISKAIVLLFIHFCVQAYAVKGYSDTTAIHAIEAVTIEHARVNFYHEDRSITRFDSLMLVLNQNASLAELLQFQTPIILKSYGATGAVSSLSMRGTNASQSQVTWNGFPINSLTTGESDLSFIGSDAANQVQIVHSAPASLYGSGTFGGVVELNNKPDFNNCLYIKVGSELTGFNDSVSKFSHSNYRVVDSWRNSARIKVGNQRVQYQLQGFEQKAANNFPYVDDKRLGSPVVYQSHSGVNAWGIVQTVNCKLSGRYSVDGGLWLQSRDKNIPLIMGSLGKSNQFQHDGSDKAFARFTASYSKCQIVVKSGFLHDNLHYTDKANETDSVYSINTKIATYRYMNDVSARWYAQSWLTVEAGVGSNNCSAIVSSYNGVKNENRYSAFVASKIKVKQMVVNFSGQYEYLYGVKIIPQLSAGLAYYLLNKRITLRSSIASKYRLPSFNDKYWAIMGNPNLKPEKGWTTEAGCDVTLLSTEKILSVVNLTGYSTKINDWIQWQPVKGMLWQPINFKTVWSRGIESGAELSYCFNRLSVKTAYKYYYTKATILSTYTQSKTGVKNQLPYVPLQSSIFSVLFMYKNIDFQYIHNFKGSFYTLENNNESNKMWPVNLINVAFGANIPVKKTAKLRFEFKVQNILNKQYQLIQSYAMPGITYQMGGYLII